MSDIKIKSETEKGFKIEIEFEYDKSMLTAEEMILETLNKVGGLATKKILERFDADGEPLKFGNQVFTSKGIYSKVYQTPWTPIKVDRHVYQSHSGGKTFCPLENDARIIVTSTPRFAKMVTSKYSEGSFKAVIDDFFDNHGRKISNKSIELVVEAVGSNSMAKETVWDYLPSIDIKSVESISLGIDGTCMLMREDGWREAMTGTIALYDKDGERLHTSYMAAPPEYGKKIFLERVEEKFNKFRNLFPDADTVGLADGAKSNWDFLSARTNHQIIDFYHVKEYLGTYSNAIFSDKEEQQEWMDSSCHKLKHTVGKASRLYNEFVNENLYKYPKKIEKEITKIVSYFKNNKSRMNYPQMVEKNMPIGSGVTEAACKLIVKQRMCNSGMRWKNKGAHVALSLRSMKKTDGHWADFWSRVDRVGFDPAI